ncbi:MAG: DNA polymerase III subunit gamma/tau [Arcobacteraceae bacterium]|nr:DNA polymerase III subunit gamma/tau [Arcobacteraceae bacterium]
MNQVLALKYRPKKFQDLIGQDTISTTLSLALDSKRLSHAYLFSGLRGSGKTSTARIMAKALVCENGPTSNPCDICANCLSANEYKHLDIIEMDAASNRGIDDIKDLIEHTKYKPSSARYKVFIIDEVHMLTTQAFNALLKTLEEPPPFVKFILATTDPLKLPATILSRTQHFRFKRIPNKDVIHHLIHILNLENISFENEALDILTRSGQGSLRDTLTLLDQAIIFSKGTITTSAVTDMMGMIDPIFMQRLFDTLLAKEDTGKFLEELESYDAGQVIDEMTIFLKYKMLANDPKFDTFLYDRFFRILGDAKQLLSINSDAGFVLILTMSKMLEATKLKTIDEVIAEVQNMKVEIQPKVVVQAPVQPAPVIQPQVESVVTTDEKVPQNEIPQEPVQVEQPIAKISENLYPRVISLVYERSHDLGECFENSFTLSSYENNKLLINSTAQGSCRTQLFKHIMFLKDCMREVYGEDTDIDFQKIEKKENPQLKEEVQSPEINSGSMIEDIEMNDYSTPQPALAQKEVRMTDVLNSPMVQKAIELFQPETPLRVNNKS